MRRSSRTAELKAVSGPILDSEAHLPPAEEPALVREPWMPRFRFEQSSPHSEETNVNGVKQIVHWVVKDRPFSIRIMEVPSPIVDGQSDEESEMTWNEVEVKAQVVYTTSKQPVQSTTAQPALSVDRSVTPSNHYNHRRTANLNVDSQQASMDGVPLAMKLKGGSGLDLHLYIRKQLVDSWYSEAIRSVSKWDKVRHLQDNSSIITHSYHLSSRSKSNSHHRSSPTAKRATSTAVGPTTPTQMTQKPVSSSLNKFNATTNGMETDYGVESPSSTSVSYDEPSTPIQHTVPHYVEHETPRSRYSSHKHSKKKKAAGEEVFDTMDAVLGHAEEFRRLALSLATSSGSPIFTKKRRASWEPSTHGYPTEEEAADAAQRSLSQHSSSISSRLSSNNNKKAKITEIPLLEQTQTHEVDSRFSHLGPAAASVARLSADVQTFLRALDSVPPEEVRSVLTSVLQTRPDLMQIFTRLMAFNPNQLFSHSSTPSTTSATITDQTMAPIAAPQQPEQITTDAPTLVPPTVNNNGWNNGGHASLCSSANFNMLMNASDSQVWAEERYALDSSGVMISDPYSITAPSSCNAAVENTVPTVSGADMGGNGVNDSTDVYNEAHSVVSPSGFDEDSTTIGSPSSSSWGDSCCEWHEEREETCEMSHIASSCLPERVPGSSPFMESFAGF